MPNAALVLAFASSILLPVAAVGAPSKLASKEAREGFIEQFNELAASNDFPFLVKFGKPDTTLSVVSTNGRCTKQLLTMVVERIGQNMRNVGFVLVDCSSDSSINVKL